MRILFWIALALLIYFAVRSKLRALAHRQKAAQERAEAEQRSQALGEGEQMTSCAHCHVYFPASEAVRADGQDFCSPAHVRLPPQ
ncbi:hypothetical protein KY495_12290 [Massilia sp. PAMC28688]|uniref:PP0621 family protein n=1 Tax=Massilia sp. PAMC28688 TaxID=2861283 RepID=UPI001C632F0F|nr:PP0621 family protein [Massilia sp. PAMC28688]QYF91591.1 hypothetical protein KY495_12290 [Massilia sp. PAMC28688]